MINTFNTSANCNDANHATLLRVLCRCRADARGGPAIASVALLRAFHVPDINSINLESEGLAFYVEMKLISLFSIVVHLI